FGFIPNFFRAQTLRPDLIDAEAGLVSAILVKEGALTRRQKEYIFLVCSAGNLSTYCVTAHCEIVRMLGIEGPEPEQIALDHTVSDIPNSEKALLDVVAEDGLQNVFLSAFQHIGSFQGNSKFLTWLTGIAINEGTGRLRTRKEMESL